MGDLQGDDKNEEYDRFTDLTKKLLTVTKADLDKARQTEGDESPPGLAEGGQVGLN